MSIPIPRQIRRETRRPRFEVWWKDAWGYWHCDAGYASLEEAESTCRVLEEGGNLVAVTTHREGGKESL